MRGARRLSRLALRLVLAVGLAPNVFAATSQSQSQSQKKAGGTHKGVVATVVTDGALVYASPSEDASILAQLPVGKQIRVSKGTTPGIQKFHKVQVGKTFGFIDDIDISMGAAPAPPHPGKHEAGTEKMTDKEKAAREKAKKKAAYRKEHTKPVEPMYFTRFVGLAIGAQEFKEGILGVNSSQTIPVYGLKITGPDVLLKGPIMDINLLLHYGAPSYYNNLSVIQPNGFIIFADAMFVLPFVQRQNSMVYISAGPLLVYSKFGVVNNNQTMDLQALELGVDAALGVGFRLGKIAIKFEGKYYLEKQQYKSLLASLQTGF